jgi:hypothetical protein
VVAAGPLSEDTRYKLQSIYNISAFSGRADKGYSSPIENMATVLQHYFNEQQQQPKKKNGGVGIDTPIQGVLYIHDDTLVNITQLQPWLGSSTTIIASADTSNPREGWSDNPTRMQQVAETSYSILSDRTVVKVDGYHTNNSLDLVNTMKSRWRWRECITRWDTLTMDPLSHAFLEPDGSFLVPSPSFGGSDFLYVPLRFSSPFSQIASLLTKHNVFLECGFPKLVDILRQQHNATTVSVSLCTTFLKRRGTMEMIERCSKPLAVVHPLKMRVLGPQNWSMAFDHIIS